jgi:hypothetical protein
MRRLATLTEALSSRPANSIAETPSLLLSRRLATLVMTAGPLPPGWR